MVIIDLHCIKPYVSFCLKTCVKFIDENVSQLLERNVKLTWMHCGIASASQHVFGGKDAFEGWIKAGTLIFHFSSLQASVTQLGFFVMKHGLLIKKKKLWWWQVGNYRHFDGLHAKQKSSNPFFGLFVSFLNCVYCLVFYMYHSTVTVSNLYFHVNIIR